MEFYTSYTPWKTTLVYQYQLEFTNQLKQYIFPF